MKTTRGRLARRVALVAAGVVVGGLAQVGCGSSAVTFATGVRVDQLLVRDLSVTVSTTGAVLTWTTRDSAPSQINYGLTTGLGNKVTGDSQPNQHKVELTGLTPDTTYYYQVYGDSTTFRLRTMGGKRQWIAFVSDRDAGQREVYLGYENIENLVRVSSGGGWNPALSVDGKHLAWTGPGAGGHTDIYTAQLDTNGVVAGSIVDVTNTPDRDETEPTWSPDGTQLAFVGATSDITAELVVRTLATSAEAVLQNNGSAVASPRWRPAGSQIAFASTTRTALVQTNQRPINVTGINVVLNETQRTTVPPNTYQVIDATQGLIDFSGSSAGNRKILIDYTTSAGAAVVAEQHTVPKPHLEIFTVSPDGSNLRRLTDSTDLAAKTNPAWHPTDATLAMVSEIGTATNLFTLGATGGAAAGLTRGAFADRNPAWSPDGTVVVFSSNRHPSHLVNLFRVDLTGRVDQLNLFSSGDTEPVWSVVP